MNLSDLQALGDLIVDASEIADELPDSEKVAALRALLAKAVVDIARRERALQSEAA